MIQSKLVKIAITGKGGVGKTTIAAVLSHLYAAQGRNVIAVDADPDANLASAFGLSDEERKRIRPIAEMNDLIEERTGARPGGIGGVFKLNPRVDDIPESCSHNVGSHNVGGQNVGGQNVGGHNSDGGAIGPDVGGQNAGGIKLLVMGRSKEAASGCYCPEGVFLKRLLKHLVLEKEHVVVLDMEAGIEHLTRGTTEAVDAFVVVVEPGRRSIQTALTVRDMAKGLGVKDVFVVANKVRGPKDVEFVKSNIEDMEFVGAVSFSADVVEADLKGIDPFERAEGLVAEILKIKLAIEQKRAGR
jgi:CO dehydrogenase maturation factor